MVQARGTGWSWEGPAGGEGEGDRIAEEEEWTAGAREPTAWTPVGGLGRAGLKAVTMGRAGPLPCGVWGCLGGSRVPDEMLIRAPELMIQLNAGTMALRCCCWSHTWYNLYGRNLVIVIKITDAHTPFPVVSQKLGLLS